METNVDLFCSVVNNELKDKSKSKGVRWDDLIIRCEWIKEIIEFMNESSSGTHAILEQATFDMPCQFDTDTISRLQAQRQPITKESLD